jgi:Na+/proline symporter
MRTIDQLSIFWKVMYLIGLFGAALGASIFPALYGGTVRWWETPMGRYMMYKGIVLGLTLDYIVIRVFLPHTPAWVGVLFLDLICVMVWWYTILFIRTYFKGRRKKRQEKKEKV